MASETSEKMIWCPKDGAHQIMEKDMVEHMMIEGFRWSIGLTARVLVRTIMDGSTAVMQAIHFDDSKRLRRALLDAPRAPGRPRKALDGHDIDRFSSVFDGFFMVFVMF